MTQLSNVRHERFCLELASGCSQAEAARRAGYRASRARKSGSALMARDDIGARLTELREEAGSAKVISIIRRKEELSSIIFREAIPRPLMAIAAIAELNKMDRAYEEPKEERPPIRIIEVHLTDEPRDGARALPAPGLASLS